MPIPKKKKKSKIIFHYISDLEFTFFRRSMEETWFSCSLPYKTLLYTCIRNSDQLGNAWTDRFFSISACIDTLSSAVPFFSPPSFIPFPPPSSKSYYSFSPTLLSGLSSLGISSVGLWRNENEECEKRWREFEGKARMSMLKAANGLVEILNGSKDPVLVHHVAMVQFLRRRRPRCGERGWMKIDDDTGWNEVGGGWDRDGRVES